MICTRSPGCGRSFGSLTKPFRSRALISLMMSSGTWAGSSPLMTNLMTPGQLDDAGAQLRTAPLPAPLFPGYLFTHIELQSDLRQETVANRIPEERRALEGGSTGLSSSSPPRPATSRSGGAAVTSPCRYD
jgi:hypothetical protein